MRRKRLPPDDARPSWRKCPVYKLDGTLGEPEKLSQTCNNRMRMREPDKPEWRYDPTYNLKEKKRARRT